MIDDVSKGYSVTKKKMKQIFLKIGIAIKLWV